MTEVTAPELCAPYRSSMELDTLQMSLTTKLFSLLAAVAVLAPLVYVITQQAVRLSP